MLAKLVVITAIVEVVRAVTLHQSGNTHLVYQLTDDYQTRVQRNCINRVTSVI